MRRRDERKLEETRFIPLPVTCRLQGLMTRVASPILPSLEPHILPAQRNENLLAFRAISSPGALPIIRIGHETKRPRYLEYRDSGRTVAYARDGIKARPQVVTLSEIVYLQQREE